MRRLICGALAGLMVAAIAPAASAAQALAVTIELSPIVDTKEVGSMLTASVAVRDAASDPIAAATVIVRVAAGGHSGEDLDGIGVTPPGVVGSCDTDAAGRCERSYRGTVVTQDALQAFVDANGNAVLDPSEIQITVPIHWVAVGEGTQTVRLDMQGCDADVSAPIVETGWTETATADTVGPARPVALCAARFDNADALSPGPVHFSIVRGPGHFTDVTGLQDLGSVFTADVSGAYVFAYLTSIQTGTTVVRATAEGAQTLGSKPWSAARARGVSLAVPPAGASGNTVEAVATVRDRYGNPVPGVDVGLLEAGSGRFLNESSSMTVTTGDSGEARAGVSSNAGETGTQTITAVLSSLTTDCGLGEGVPDPAAPAGVCIATAAIEWGFGAQTLTLRAAPSAAVWGTAFTVTATLTSGGLPVAGRVVTIARQAWTASPGSAFVSPASGVTDAQGRLTIVDRPSANARYRASVAGNPPAEAVVTGLAVRPGVLFNASAERVPAGAAASLTGRVLPAHPGSRVALQQLTGSGWKTVASAVLDATSSYRLTVRRGSPASLLYRVAIGSDADHAWNVSINRRVTWF
ncbi:MAG TPA: hypothetical protein VGB64_04360 [Actinomycetota bacterium]